MVKKITKYLKFVVCCALILSLIAPSYAALSASDGSAFVTKAEFDSALADFNARLTTFEAGINSKIDSQVTSYLDRNGIWNGKEQTLVPGAHGGFCLDALSCLPRSDKYGTWTQSIPNYMNLNNSSSLTSGYASLYKNDDDLEYYCLFQVCDNVSTPFPLFDSFNKSGLFFSAVDYMSQASARGNGSYSAWQQAYTRWIDGTLNTSTIYSLKTTGSNGYQSLLLDTQGSNATSSFQAGNWPTGFVCSVEFVRKSGSDEDVVWSAPIAQWSNRTNAYGLHRFSSAVDYKPSNWGISLIEAPYHSSVLFFVKKGDSLFARIRWVTMQISTSGLYNYYIVSGAPSLSKSRGLNTIGVFDSAKVY